MQLDKFPRAFVLERSEDVSGVSGIGIVAWGVEFPDGVVALRWKGDWPTSVVFHDRGIASVDKIHGHDGRTRIVWERFAPSVAYWYRHGGTDEQTKRR